MFSKACQYGIKAMIFIAEQSSAGKRSNLGEISTAIQSPKAFTAKILQQLVKSSAIISIKGSCGGFEVNGKSIKTLTVMHIVTAIDGDNLMHDCVLGQGECSGQHPCPLHKKYKDVRKNIAVLANTRIIDLVKKFRQKTGVLKV